MLPSQSRKDEVMMKLLPPVRRIVTGHDIQGRAIFATDGQPPTVVSLESLPGVRFHEIWSTAESPAPVDWGPDPTLRPLELAPPKLGSLIRVVDFPPDSMHQGLTAAQSSAAFTEIGAPQARTAREGSPHGLMHRTETIDYGICIAGELWLVIDDSETRLVPGDIVVQRGTNHAWSNRTQELSRMVFVLLDGRDAPELAARLAG